MLSFWEIETADLKIFLSYSVYGDIEVTKLECVGHLQKCMGSRLL